MPEMRYGGQVRTRVMVSLKPRDPTTVGKKLLKLHADFSSLLEYHLLFAM